MEYKLALLDRQDRKNIYLILLFFSSPGIIISLVFMALEIYMQTSGIFIDSLLLISASVLLPHIFSVKYVLALKKNQKYIIKGVLTSVYRNRNGNSWYTINNIDKFKTASIGNIFCDRLKKGNMVELHILPYMYSKKKIFYAKRLDESYEMTVIVLDLEIDKTGHFITISFSDFGKHTFIKSFFYDSLKIGDTLLIKVATEAISGKPLFSFKKLDNLHR